jgi:hypothetical protein
LIAQFFLAHAQHEAPQAHPRTNESIDGLMFFSWHNLPPLLFF